MKCDNKSQRGAALIVVLVFTSIFMIVGIGLLQLVGTLYKTSIKKQSSLRALQIAEAGINYYKWRLSHSPADYSGSGDYDYTDPYGGIIGHYNLQITPPNTGSTIVTIRSTGYINEDPNVHRTLEVKFGQRSLSDYSFFTHSNVWFGEDEEVKGKVHSNGGIRMDGEGDSIIESSREKYICGPEHGCNYIEHDGVWGTGRIQELWHFPPAHQVPTIDFNSISVNLAGENGLKEKAQSADGDYIGYSGSFGYRIKFNTNPATYDLYRVTSTRSSYGYDFSDGWQWRYIDIRNQTYVATYPVPANGIIFVEDQVWVDGTVEGRITLAAANFLATGSDRSIIINGDISYAAKDGNHVLGLIAQKDILIPLYSPERLEINAAMIAQKGHVFIYNYQASRYGASTVVKDYIEVYGSIGTNNIWTWSWVNSQGNVISGYEQTETIFDNNLTYSPPPNFPHKEEYEQISWKEIH